MAQAPALPTRTLGRTGLEVTALGLGCAPLGDIYERLDEDTALATIKAAVDGGITLFDTAPFYGQGIAEHRLGTVLRSQPRGAHVLSTKVGRWMKPAPDGRTKTSRFVGGLEFDVMPDYTYDGIMKSFEHSLIRLGLPEVDVLLVHDADAWGYGPERAEELFRIVLDSGQKALEKLRSAGVIKGYGLGLNDPEYAARYLSEGDFDCLLMAGRYSLIEQPALAEVLPIAREKNAGVMLGGVYNSGILATGAKEGAKYNYLPAPPEILDKVAHIEKVCQAHGVALPVAAIHFCLGQPAVSAIVLGAVKPVEVTANIEAVSASVPAGLWSDLKGEGLLPDGVPVPA
jgi:D-threo-aldose 1-dehydrogenase